MRAAAVVGPVVAVVAAAFLVLARPAPAQGLDDQLPDPITVDELASYLDRFVHPTAPQRVAIERLHEAYQDEFAAMRRNELEALAAFDEGGAGVIPSALAQRRRVATTRRLLQLVRGLDGRFWDQAAAALAVEPTPAAAPAQPAASAGLARARLARARLARDRATFRRPVAEFAAGELPPDLGELVVGMELAPEVQARIDAIIEPYEIGLTRGCATAIEEGFRADVALYDALEAAGLAGADLDRLFEDAERGRRYADTMAAVLGSSDLHARDNWRSLMRLTHETADRIAAELPAEERRRFRRSFASAAYPWLSTIGGGAERWLGAAIAAPELGDDVRARLGEFLDRVREEDGRLLRAAMEAVDEARCVQLSADDPERAARLEAAMVERVADRRELELASVESAQAFVGPALAKRLARLAPAPLRFDRQSDAVIAMFHARQPDFAAMMPGAIETAGGDEAGEALADGDGAVVPEADAEAPDVEGSFFVGSLPVQQMFSSSDVAVWSRRLGLAAADRTALDALHADHVARWAAEVQPHIDRANGAAASADGLGDRPADDAAILAYHAAHVALRSAAEATRQAFVDAVRLAFGGGDRTAAVELLDLEAAIWPNTYAYIASPECGVRRSALNPVEVLWSTLGDEMPRGPATAVLVDHGAGLRRASREVHLASATSVRNVALAFAAQQRDPTLADDPAAAQAALMTTVAELQSAPEAAARRWLEVQTRAIHAVCAVLPPGRSEPVRIAIGRRVCPALLDERGSAEATLVSARAAALDDDARLAILAALESKCVERDRRLTMHVLDLAERLDLASTSGLPTASAMRLQRELALARFERQELRARLRRDVDALR